MPDPAVRYETVIETMIKISMQRAIQLYSGYPLWITATSGIVAICPSALASSSDGEPATQEGSGREKKGGRGAGFQIFRIGGRIVECSDFEKLEVSCVFGFQETKGSVCAPHAPQPNPTHTLRHTSSRSTGQRAPQRQT